MVRQHAKLTRLLQQAYSAERAASFAYIGHANSVKNPEEREAIRQIEQDEWHHRDVVLRIMQAYDIPVSRYFEWKYWFIGRSIGTACHVIGWFMPFYFAGRLESGNVCEYFRMMHYFEELGISEHHQDLYDMGIKEKEHEDYFQAQVDAHPLLFLFERVFGWGKEHSLNDVDLQDPLSVEQSTAYCRSDHKR